MKKSNSSSFNDNSQNYNPDDKTDAVKEIEETRLLRTCIHLDELQLSNEKCDIN